MSEWNEGEEGQIKVEHIMRDMNPQSSLGSVWTNEQKQTVAMSVTCLLTSFVDDYHFIYGNKASKTTSMRILINF